MKRYLSLAIALLLTALAGARGQSLDDQYVQIFNLIQEADALTATQPRQAVTKYSQAQARLEQMQRGTPDWNSKVVHFRLNYVRSRIAELAGAAPAPAPAAPAAAAETAAVGSDGAKQIRELQDQLAAFRDQIRDLQSEKELLEAKLKEAFAAQPAAADPRELAKAQDKLKLLLKENDLLQAALAGEKAKAAPASQAALEENRRALEEANRKLAVETRRADGLAAEKQALQQKLESLTPAAWNAAQAEKAKKALEETSQQLDAQQQAAAKWAAERETLQNRIHELSAQTDAAAALRAENELLKKQLTKAGAAEAKDLPEQLAAARAQTAALQSERDILRLEKTALENRLRQMSGSAAPVSLGDNSAARIQQLERERDDLRRHLETASKQLSARNSKIPITSEALGDLELQLITARARLSVYEARATPYTAEELALFNRPGGLVAAPAAPSAAAAPLSAAAVKLVAEAKRHFAAHEYDQAEQAYLEVLKENQASVPALAELATVQMENHNHQAAEANVRKALALQPDNAYSLSILGNLMFRQGKYDEALDALSRAAKLDPNNAEIQNFLGLTLSEKGLRGPAEAALRRAVQLQPGYGSAHHNLAVVYISQKPPMVELARWHYQKALAAGIQPNPDLEKLINAAK